MISAKEINRQAGRLQNQLTKYTRYSFKIRTELDMMQRVVKSEDSSLARVLGNYINTFEVLEKQIRLQFSRTAELMNRYAKETIQNEEQIVKTISSLGNEMQDIASTVGKLSTSTEPEVLVSFD